MADRPPEKNEQGEYLTKQLLLHHRALLAYAYVLVLDHHKAEDVLQETAVTLLRRAQEFGEVQNFWLLAKEITRRHALDLLKKERNAARKLCDPAIVAIEAGFDQVYDPDGWRVDDLLQCISKLPAAWQQVLRMRYWMQMPVGQIATQLSRSASSISVTLNRARVRLTDCLRRTRRLEEFA